MAEATLPALADTPEAVDAAGGAVQTDELPPGWIAVATDEGETYYWNQETQETSWEVPVAAPPNLRVSRI